MTASFVAIGDIHLDALKNLFPNNHLELQLAELNKTTLLAVERGERDVVLLGDIAENIRLSYEAQVAFIRYLCQWDGKVNIHIILGNHDFAENGVHSLQPFIEMQDQRMFKTVRFYTKPEVVKIKGVKVNMQPYPFFEPEKNAINIGHYEVSGSIRDNGRIIKKSHDVNKKDVWIMGHLHTPHSVGNVHYSGTLYQLNFGESLPKGSMLVQARLSEGKLKHRIERIRNDPAFKLINLVVESKRDLKQIEKNPLYKYRILAHSEFEAPYDIMQKHPNVVKTDGFTSKEELKAIVEDSFIEIKHQNLELPSTSEILKDYFKAKGADAKKIKRALALVKQVRGIKDVERS